ncbi:MAG: hypothetical protein ACRET5_16435 [Steroidobacteraceae bacterium]
MTPKELRSSMAAQIFAALVAEQGDSLLGSNMEAVAKKAVEAVKMIEEELAKSLPTP